MTAGRFMGQAVARTEDPRLLTGRGRYIADVVVGGASDAAFLRSEVARGRIVRLDATTGHLVRRNAASEAPPTTTSAI